MKKRKKLAVLFAMLLVIGGSYIANAQEITGWEPVRIIPGFSTEVLTPYLVADQNRTVHAFVSDWVGEDGSIKAVLYSQWRRDQGWSLPVDVILSPHHEARVKGAFLDSEGWMHVVFFGGEDTNAEIYYSQAPAIQAGQALAWSEPVIVGQFAITPDEAAIAGDDRGNLHIVFGARADGNSLLSVHSSDGGQTWSEPVPVFQTLSNEFWPSQLQIYVDANANLHAVWALGDTTGNSVAVYYAKLEASTAVWTEPIMLAPAINGEADTPSIIEYNDELFVIYHNDLPTTRWMRRSKDGGRTWSDPVRLFEQVGSNGAASMVIDGNNTLHMFFGNRLTGPPTIQGMWHSTWLGSRWSMPVAIISGPARADFDPSFAKAVVSQGDTLLVAWHQDPRAVNTKGASFSFTLLDAPANPVIPLPSAQIQPEVIPEVINIEANSDPTPTVEAEEVNSNLGTAPVINQINPSRSIMVGLMPVILVVLVFVLYKLRYR